jgi:hypothetical protein
MYFSISRKADSESERVERPSRRPRWGIDGTFDAMLWVINIAMGRLVKGFNYILDALPSWICE